MLEQVDNEVKNTQPQEEVIDEKEELHQTEEPKQEENDDGEAVRPVEQQEEKPEQKKSRGEARIKNLLNKNKETEEKLATERERAKALEKEIASLKSSERPDPDKYDDDDDYEIDKNVYIQDQAEKKRKERLLEQTQESLKTVAQQRQEAIIADFREKLNALPQESKDFISQNTSSFRPRSDISVENEVMESKYGAQIYEVILQDANRFNSMTDVQFLKEVGKLEDRFENAKKAVKPPKAVADPPSILEGGNVGSSDAKSNNTPDWAKYTYQQLRNM